jgi:enoyl-[acyl-carrier protein] reductase III
MKERKTAVVTGGTRGIGRAISLALAATGYTVYAIYARNRDAADALSQDAAARGLEVRCLRGDLTDPDALAHCAGVIKAGAESVHVLAHSAASGVHRKVSELSAKHLAWTLNVNLVAFHQLLSELLPLIPPGGRILGITSHGPRRILPCYAAVAASKGGMETLFRYYAHEFARRGIAVNLVCPGLVLTGALEAFPDREQRIGASVANTPTGRLTTPEDVASAVLFLCSDGASQIIGQTIVVDGGVSLA